MPIPTGSDRRGKARIASARKRGGPGVTIDVPLAHKDPLYVRSHYDTNDDNVAGRSYAREIAVILGAATRVRLHARLGVLAAETLLARMGSSELLGAAVMLLRDGPEIDVKLQPLNGFSLVSTISGANRAGGRVVSAFLAA